jgi:hypothetical protein
VFEGQHGVVELRAELTGLIESKLTSVASGTWEIVNAPWSTDSPEHRPVDRSTLPRRDRWATIISNPNEF